MLVRDTVLFDLFCYWLDLLFFFHLDICSTLTFCIYNVVVFMIISSVFLCSCYLCYPFSLLVTHIWHKTIYFSGEDFTDNDAALLAKPLQVGGDMFFL